MDLLKRGRAPILDEAWKVIDEEARRVLELHLAGRKIVDFAGPHGWKLGAVNTGRLEPLEPSNGVEVGRRTVAPLLEVRIPFVLQLPEIDSVGRGAVDPDLDAVIDAAERIARFEDGAIFNGHGPGGIEGIIPSSPHDPVAVGSLEAWPVAVAKAKESLRAAGIGGPYVLAAGKSAYDELMSGSDEGYPLRKRVEQQLADGRIVWAPAVECAVLVSARGSDYELTVGQDLSIGYAYHERDTVGLFLVESFTFRVLEPSAAVALRRA